MVCAGKIQHTISRRLRHLGHGSVKSQLGPRSIQDVVNGTYARARFVGGRSTAEVRFGS